MILTKQTLQEKVFARIKIIFAKNIQRREVNYDR